MTLLYAIASDVGVMLLVTINGMKLLPRSRDAVVLDSRNNSTGRTSRFHAWKTYDGLPTTGTPSPTRVAELDGEII